MNNDFDLWPFVPSVLISVLLVFLVWLLVFGFFGAIAAIVAPDHRKLRWFLLTFFILGPLGVGFAAIAPEVVPKVDDAWHFQCERCGAHQNVEHETKTADCYRCADTLF